ncbi:MAG: hypothetical protein ABIG03_01425 [Candidatus Eisenbacteria bacterium]
MKKLLVAWMCVMLASPAAWSGQPASASVEGPSDQDSPSGRAVVADVLVAIDIDGQDGAGLFHDLTQRYVDAFLAAGATTVHTASTEVTGGSINFPPNLTGANYPLVVVLGSDNFFGGANNIDATDEAALAAYLDSGGSLMLVGQDYMSSAHPEMNAPASCSGFPRSYLGLDMSYQDFDTPGPGMMNLRSYEANIISIIIVVAIIAILGSIAFPRTGYILTDRATPTRTAQIMFDYEGEFASGTGVVVLNETRGFRTVYSGVELAGADTEDFNYLISTLYYWLRTGDTPVEQSSWTAVKAMFR